VESCNPSTPQGRIRLDASDVREVLLLSEELKLDELQSLLCLLTAHDEASAVGGGVHDARATITTWLTHDHMHQRGEVAAEVAAGVYFEERRGLVAALHRLLQVQALPAPEEQPAEVAEAVARFNEDLLMLRSQGRSLLVTRLMELIAVSAPPSWPFHPAAINTSQKPPAALAGLQPGAGAGEPAGQRGGREGRGSRPARAGPGRAHAALRGVR
jgi:hypothetical protein